MTKEESALQAGRRYGAKRAAEIWDNLGKNNLWKRILKNVVATTLLVSICLIPRAKDIIGKAAYLGAITTVFGHPGRRFGQLAEALILAVSGTIIGVAWATFGLYLASLVIGQRPAAAYAIRGIFLAFVVLIHGFLRSKTPRLFIFVLLMLIASTVSLTTTAKTVTRSGATSILYPILIAAACITIVNVIIFPEFSSRFLGQTTIDTLNDTSKVLEDAGHYFVGASKAREPGQKSTHEPEQEGSRATLEVGPELAASGRISVYTRVIHALRKLFTKRAANSDVEAPTVLPQILLTDLTSSKEKIRKKLAVCKAAQTECNFEIAISVLPPRYMKPISVRAMKRLVANTIAIISACESKFALLGGEDNDKADNLGQGLKSGEIQDEKDDQQSHCETKNATADDRKMTELEMIKPKREIGFGDARLLRYLLARVTKAYKDLHCVVARTVEFVNAGVAYTYDVPSLPSGATVPKSMNIEEVDVYLDSLKQALLRFDADSASALEGAAAIEETKGKNPDIMPREEVFLMSSFLLNVQQAATHIEEMLKESRELIRRRQERNSRRRLYAPHIKWSNWLYTGGDEDEGLPTTASRENRQGTSKKGIDDDDDDDNEGDGSSLSSNRSAHAAKSQTDIEKNDGSDIKDGEAKKETPEPKTVTHESKNPNPEKKDKSLSLRLRGQAADALEWLQSSDDVLYAVKLGFAVFLVLWPAFLTKWNDWFSVNRGIWAAFQLILITEVSIGTSVMTFILRGIGTTLGCLWGWAALEARNSNRVVVAIMVSIGIFPCAYVQLGTKYPKAGMVCIISICVITLATELDTVPGSSTENFLKRWIAFMVGGAVALVVEMVLIPVKARTRLVESLAAALVQINEMEKCIAAGIETGVNVNIHTAKNFQRFEHASGKANTALSAAETFLPFCSHEPRIKGSFEGLALIYSEILFVLHQIVDRMDNMLQLRTAYGSGPLEELNAEIYHYRRNVAGSITLTLFVTRAALTTKLPLPQYLPSPRLAHLRMINRVREVVLASVSSSGKESGSHEMTAKLARQRAVRRKYMSWNAASAAQAEIIEFLEELVDLTKLLVGANEFRSGLLTKPTYHDYAAGRDEKEDDGGDVEEAETRDEFLEEPVGGTVGVVRRRRDTTASSRSSGSEIPASLRRIQSRKIEAGVQRQKTNEEWEERNR